MPNTVQEFNKVQSLDVLYDHLNLPLADGEWGILALDLDQTLIQARPTLGDEHFYRFLMEQNRAQGLDPDAHYRWTAKIRAEVPYEACGSVEKINSVISEFRERGWTVKVLTSRGLDMRSITEKHLGQSGIDLSLDDVIFREFHPDGSGRLLRKDESLIGWMEGQHRWPTAERIRVLFLDDSEKYCSQVARVAEKVNRAAVTCLHYTAFVPQPQLSVAQMEQLVVQLHAYREGRPIPYEFDQDQLKLAMRKLAIKDINSDALYTVIIKIAERDGLPLHSPRR